MQFTARLSFSAFGLKAAALCSALNCPPADITDSQKAEVILTLEEAALFPKLFANSSTATVMVPVEFIERQDLDAVTIDADTKEPVDYEYVPCTAKMVALQEEAIASGEPEVDFEALFPDLWKALLFRIYQKTNRLKAAIPGELADWAGTMKVAGFTQMELWEYPEGVCEDAVIWMAPPVKDSEDQSEILVCACPPGEYVPGSWHIGFKDDLGAGDVKIEWHGNVRFSEVKKIVLGRKGEAAARWMNSGK